MERSEVAILLAYVQAFDNRNLGDDGVEVLAWHDALGNFPFEDAKEAVRRFFATEKGWIMPGDVFRLMKQVRADRERDSQRQSAITAAPRSTTHQQLKQTAMERYRAQFEDGVKQGNAERAYSKVMRETNDPVKAHAAARAANDNFKGTK